MYVLIESPITVVFISCKSSAHNNRRSSSVLVNQKYFSNFKCVHYTWKPCLFRQPPFQKIVYHIVDAIQRYMNASLLSMSCLTIWTPRMSYFISQGASKTTVYSNSSWGEQLTFTWPWRSTHSTWPFLQPLTFWTTLFLFIQEKTSTPFSSCDNC